MMRVLIPVDGSETGLNAVRATLRQGRGRIDRIDLVNVQPRLPLHVARFVPRRDRDSWRRERAERALEPARRLVEAAGIACGTHRAVGPLAKAIADLARELRVSEIVMSAARRGPLGGWLSNAASARLLEAASVPVRVIPAAPAPALERLAVPLGIGVALLVLAAED